MTEPVRAATHSLEAKDLTLAYDKVEVAKNLSLTIPPGRISCIVGANACGKSTLLRALSRLLKPHKGSVLLDGQSIHRLPTKTVAMHLGILPQSPIAPEGITVADLVARGRYPHQKWFRQWTTSDEEVITGAMVATRTLDLAGRPVDELSGGQRQRVWIAMALAQGTDLMLLDEPTTFLDLAHQVEVLDLLVELNHQGRTIVMVLHDLNHACRYSHHLLAMREGSLVAEGPPQKVVTEAMVKDVFDLRSMVLPDPVSGTPMVIPIGRHHNVSEEDRFATEPDPEPSVAGVE
ncbi:MAG: ABC transporter ATP-binding protein [Actinomycetota bacterium]